MFENTFKNIDDILHKDAGCSNELDYVEQTSWILFLKYLDDFEQDKKTAAELTGKPYEPIIAADYKWERWAAPKGKDGKIDHNNALTGEKNPPALSEVRIASNGNVTLCTVKASGCKAYIHGAFSVTHISLVLS